MVSGSADTAVDLDASLTTRSATCIAAIEPMSLVYCHVRS